MIFSSEWCELVFEGRNHLYGAYQLRQNSAKRHVTALIMASSLIILIALLPYLLHYILPGKAESDLRIRTLSEINLEKPKENDILKEVPPPPQELRNTIKFTPPVIKPDEHVNEEDEPKMQKEVSNEKAAIGVVNFNKGTDDISAPIAVEEAKIAEDKDEIFVFVEQMPEFPGGAKEMIKFISSHLYYPSRAQEMGITGTVYLRFVVAKNGKIENIEVIRGIGGGCDEEAVKVLGIMPPWKPGKQGGKTVKAVFTLPIKFVVQKTT